MRFDVISLFPEMIRKAAAHGVTGRALERNIVQLRVWDPRDYTQDRYRRVDDRPFGGGPGMVMKVEPLRRAIQAARSDAPTKARTIYLSPQGRLLKQRDLVQFAGCERLILIAGRYEGVDERLIETEVDEEWSIGDYVISGGELSVLVLFDGVVRLLPGVLGHGESAAQDSHMEGLLDCPHYTRPEDLDGMRVPEVLVSGNHEAIRRWRLRESLGRTWLRRPELLEDALLDKERRQLLKEFQETHDRE